MMIMILLNIGLRGECRVDRSTSREVLEMGNKDGKLWVLSDIFNRSVGVWSRKRQNNKTE